MRLGFGEIVIILLVVLLVFGPSKLPQLGEALGKGIRSFKRATLEPDPDESSREAEQARLSAGSLAAKSAPAAKPAPTELKKA